MYRGYLILPWRIPYRNNQWNILIQMLDLWAAGNDHTYRVNALNSESVLYTGKGLLLNDGPLCGYWPHYILIGPFTAFGFTTRWLPVFCILPELSAFTLVVEYFLVTGKIIFCSVYFNKNTCGDWGNYHSTRLLFTNSEPPQVICLLWTPYYEDIFWVITVFPATPLNYRFRKSCFTMTLGIQ